jgi:sugar transferase (PEP-CTERM/EpsH1 system associated)
MQELLFLPHRIPYPPDKGDKIRSYHVLRYLSRHFRVHLGTFIDDPADARHIGAVSALCASSCFIERAPWRARLRSARALVTGQPLSLPYYHSDKLQRWVNERASSGAVSQALAFSGPMAQYLLPRHDTAAGIRDALAKLHRVIDFVDVDSEKWLQYAPTQRWPLSQLYRREARRLLAYEREVAGQLDAATFVSAAEAALFRRRAPEAGQRIACFNNGVDTDYFSPFAGYANPYPDGATVLVFTGAMDYWPNADAVTWFGRSVMPVLRSQFPSLLFYIVGARPSAQVRRLSQLPGVLVTGSVADVRPYLAHAVLAVAPLRVARGVQNKVLEAMAMQKTVVASPQALEGIGAQPGSELVLAEESAEFVAQITRLLHGKADRGIGVAARKRVMRDHRWDTNLARLGALLGLPQAAALALPESAS